MNDNMGLFDYAASHPDMENPVKDNEGARDTARIIAEEKELKADAEELKRLIGKRIHQGDHAHFILYTAVKCIGLLSHDPEWMDEQTAALNELYGDLSQESLFVDNAATAAERVEKKQRAFMEKLRKRIIDSRKGLNNIRDGLDTLEILLNIYFPEDQPQKQD